MAKDKIKETRLTEAEADMLTLLSLVQGRRFLFMMMDRCGIDSSSYNLASQVMYFNEGKRAVGLELKRDILLVDAKSYELMVRENLTTTTGRAMDAPDDKQADTQEQMSDG